MIQYQSIMDFDLKLEKTILTENDKIKGTLLIKSSKFDINKFDLYFLGEEKVTIPVKRSSSGKVGPKCEPVIKKSQISF